MNENWFNAPVTDAERRENFPLTAAVEGSAEQDRPSREVGVTYEVGATGIWRRVGHEIAVAIGDVDPGELQLEYAREMAQRANALPEVEAQLAEAVELLRKVLKTADFPGEDTEDLGTVEAYIHTFLAKQVKP